jgi:hypothetical protein
MAKDQNSNYEDGASLDGDVASQNKALANIINPTDDKKSGPSDDAINAITKQILGQNLTSKWQGQGHGSAEANARDMARIMASIGITDIKQFGQVPKYEQATIRDGYNGQVAQQDEDGNYFVLSAPDEEGVRSRVNVDPSQIGKAYGYQDPDGNFVTVDPSQVVVKNGAALVETGKVFGNKLTGQEVPLTYSERQTGNAFGGTFAGKDNTGYRVQFGPDGTPYFYTTKSSSNDLANLMQDLGPLGQIGLAIATGGLSIPEQIAANMAFQVLSGKDIGDAIKSAAVSMAMSQIPGTDFMKDGVKYIEKMGLGETLTNTLTNSLQNAAVSGVKAIITGQDIGAAVLNGAAMGGVNGAVNSLLNSVDGYKDLSAGQKKMVSNSVTGILSGKPLEQTLINSAIAAANAEVKDQLRYKPLSQDDYDALSIEQKDIYDNGGTKAYVQYVRDQKAAAAEQEKNTNNDGVNVVGKTEIDNPVLNTFELPKKPVDPVIPIPPVDSGTVTVKSKSDTCPIGTVYNPDTDSCDPIGSQVTTPAAPPPVIPTTVPSTGTVTVTGKSDTCPIGTVYNPETDSCDPIGSEYTKSIQTSIPIEKPVDSGTVNITSKRDTCPIGTIYNPVTDSCDPLSEATAGKKIDEQPTMTIVGKRDTCPIGTVYNPETDSCDPVTQTSAPAEQPVVQPTQQPTQQPVKTTAVKTAPTKSTSTAPVKTADSSFSSFPYQPEQAAAPRYVTPDLANVFYFGKDFSSKKQKLNELGEIEDTVNAAHGGLVDELKNRENNANDALDLILGQSGNSLSLDDLLNIVKGS